MTYRIFENGELVNTIVAEEAFCNAYCEANGYTYELEERAEPKPVPAPKTTEERIAELENALCDMDAANEEAHATYETALCDLDETLNGGTV